MAVTIPSCTLLFSDIHDRCDIHIRSCVRPETRPKEESLVVRGRNIRTKGDGKGMVGIAQPVFGKQGAAFGS
jgi:hypothetical protein